MYALKVSGGLLLSALVSGMVRASTVELSITATVTAPTCTLNSGNAVNIDFGTVPADEIDGEKNSKSIDYNIQCTGQRDLKIKLQGTGSGFNSNLLMTDNDNVGIKFAQNETALNLNTYVTFSSDDPPGLSAVLVKKPGGNVTGGRFTATGYLVMDYQ